MSLRIQDIKDLDTVYVRNLTKTDVSFTVYNSTSHPRLILIPRATIPQEITGLVLGSTLYSSEDFKRLVLSGVLEIVPEKQALLELEDPDAKAIYNLLLRNHSALPDELMESSDNTLTPTDVVSTGDTLNTIRLEIRDGVVNDHISSQDLRARLTILHKEAPLSREELLFITSSLEENQHKELFLWLKSIKLNK